MSYRPHLPGPRPPWGSNRRPSRNLLASNDGRMVCNRQRNLPGKSTAGGDSSSAAPPAAVGPFYVPCPWEHKGQVSPKCRRRVTMATAILPQEPPTMTTPLLRRSEQLVWLFDDVECCLGQLPPAAVDHHHRRGGAGPESPLLPAPVVRRSPGAGPRLGIRGTGPICGGQRTPAFPWTGPQYPVGLRLGGALGAVPRRHRRRAARPAQPPGGFP